ncbi:DUF1294 domain-containing protein [Aureispira anguillae]|nr:DUF1294 domain-containing protein [Aureispira anguillae]
MTELLYIWLWVGILSLYTFLRMGWDKRQAGQGAWRTSEMHFFVTAILGGSVGILLGMQIWRHKTQKWNFKIPIYIIISIQLSLLYWYWFT